jgi:putative Holliday junction resolvase
MPGRLMGIDHGRKRLGVALSDPMQIIARPYTIIHRRAKADDFAALRRIIDAEGVAKIVVGLPTDSRDEIGSQARTVIRWAQVLAEAIGLPVVFWDESFSSIEAESLGRRPGEPVDDLAAAVMLQEYLEAKGTQNDEPGTPLQALEDLA